MDVKKIIWDGNLQQDGCDFCQCSRLIADKFKINSGGKTPKARRLESASRSFSSRMVPNALVFEPSAGGPLQAIENLPGHKQPRLGEALGKENSFPGHGGGLEDVQDGYMESPLKRKLACSRYADGASDAKTPSKYSFVQSASSKPSPFSSKPSPLSSLSTKLSNLHSSMIDFTSRDSGFDSSTGFEGISKSGRHRSAMEEEESAKRVDGPADFGDDPKFFDNFADGYEFETLHDLEEEFDSEIPSVSKYEVISTDSPDINLARGSSHVSRIFAKNFEFGSPIGDLETSENFGAIPQHQKLTRRLPARSETTRMLNFDLDSSANSDAPTPVHVSARAITPAMLSSLKKSARSVFSSKENSASSCSSIYKSSSADSGHFSSPVSSGSLGGPEVPELRELEELEAAGGQPSGVPSSLDALISWAIKDEDLVSGKSEMETFSPIIKRPTFRRCSSLSQGGTKRPDRSAAGGEGSAGKRRREEAARPVLARAMSENEASIKTALARSYTEPDLIGDFSRPYSLPLAESEHADLRSISVDTLAGLVDGNFSHVLPNFQVIDCRYPYEFEGGHIEGALNLYTERMVSDGLAGGALASGAALVFHCEFSRQRGPNLCRYLRSRDRALNRDAYPALRHPEVYLLRGGYWRFHALRPALCRGGYTPMLDPAHARSLRAMRSANPRRA